MFNFFKKKHEEEKTKSTLDKIVMGAIIGTAIGSVIGLAVAPKKGKETRGFFKEKIEKAKEALSREHDAVKKIPHETQDQPAQKAHIQRNTLEDLEP